VNVRASILNLDAWPLIGQAARVRRHRLGGSQIHYASTSLGDVRVRVHPSGVGPRLLFGVDGPNVLEHYDDLFGRLEGRADVIAFEPPGTGGSAPARSFDFRLGSFARLTLDLLADTGPRTLVMPCYLGHVAQLVARRAPRLAPRVVLPQTVGEADLRRWADRVDPKRLVRTPLLGQAIVAVRRRAIARGWYRASVGHAECRDPFVATADRALRAGACFCLASLMQGLTPDLVQPDEGGTAPAELPVPAVIVWGAKDRTHARSAPGLALAGAEVVLFGDSGHSPELEEPERFAEWIVAWHGVTQ
jgi:pimeloyl-ACP methyl ester carboxylesterase